MATFAHSLSFQLHKLTFLMERLAEQALKERHQLTLADVRLLMAVRHHGATSQNMVAIFHGLTEAAISRKISSLVQAKLVLRVTNPTNRREHVLMLTPRGRRTADRATRLLEQTFRPLYRALSAGEQRQLSHALDQLTRAIWLKSGRTCLRPQPTTS